jgi:hypothetical protein
MSGKSLRYVKVTLKQTQSEQNLYSMMNSKHGIIPDEQQT